MNAFQIVQEIPTVGPELLFKIGGFPVSNGLLLSLAITVILFLVSVALYRHRSLAPSKVQTVAELLYEGIADLLDQITQSRAISKKILPLIGALVIYIGFANIVTLLPGVGSITLGDVPLFRTPTSGINTTLALALAMVLLTQWVSIRDFGIVGHVGKYVQIKEVFHGFHKSIGEGFIAIIQFFVGLLDIVSELARVISLSLRLFGNMYAGEVLLVILMGAVAYAVPALWVGLSLFFGIVQAVVFAALVAAYYTLAVKQKEINE
ncbi:MAG: FoF1 ATP synthase subunit a [bacterium]|nr:FoF1 ATP synthase subunit a [bacterium]